MDNVTLQINRLRTGSPRVRYDACEELRVAPHVSQEALAALEEATLDPDPGVADAAVRAFALHTQQAPSRAGLLESRQTHQPIGTASATNQPRTLRDWIDPTRLYNPGHESGRLMFIWGAFGYPFLLTMIVTPWCGLADAILSSPNTTPISDATLVLLQPLYLSAIVLITLRRLKDLRRSGWYTLCGLVPLANFIFALWLTFAPGVRPLTKPEEVSPVTSGPLTPGDAESGPAQFCPGCGSTVLAGARFCISCGGQIPASH